MKVFNLYPVLLVLSSFLNSSSAQLLNENLKELLTGRDYNNNAEINTFYALVNYELVWNDSSDHGNIDAVAYVLNQAGNYGLRPKDYQAVSAIINKRKSGSSSSISLIEDELIVTKNVLHFCHDIAYGNAIPVFAYNGLNYKPGCYNIAGILAECVLNKSFNQLIKLLTPELPEIRTIQEKIQWIRKVMLDSNFKEVVIYSNKITPANKPLLVKLYQLWGTTPEPISVSEHLLLGYIKESQQHFSLLADGVLRTTIIEELNVPLAKRLYQLMIAINYYRWLNCKIQEQPVIVVNIPAAYLKVYNRDQLLLEMRLVVGKKSTPTPTLSSTVNKVVLYPYWHVPFNIATKELLPVIKQYPAFIQAGNYQVLNKKGEIIDPASVNWALLSTKYFPYLLRQSTGCDNALGLLKLDFINPFDVYLHDTPFKSSFMLKKRFMSHGCMRMDKPMELGHLILKNNSQAIDTLTQKGILSNQSPVIVQADFPMPVVIWYNPVGIDSSQRLLFYEDCYGKFNSIIK